MSYMLGTKIMSIMFIKCNATLFTRFSYVSQIKSNVQGWVTVLGVICPFIQQNMSFVFGLKGVNSKILEEFLK